MYYSGKHRSPKLQNYDFVTLESLKLHASRVTSHDNILFSCPWEYGTLICIFNGLNLLNQLYLGPENYKSTMVTNNLQVVGDVDWKLRLVWNKTKSFKRTLKICTCSVVVFCDFDSMYIVRTPLVKLNLYGYLLPNFERCTILC